MNKKKILSIFGAAAIVTAATINFNISLHGESLSNLTLANVMALASGEDPEDIWEDCLIVDYNYFDEDCYWTLWLCYDGWDTSGPNSCIAK
jgi:hypothetical protein